MNREDFDREILKYAQEIEINLNEEQIEKFYKFMNLLLEWNEKMNLTAITDYHEIILKHFIDSITISKYIEQNAKIVDVGTGAGFPGIPLKIVRKDIKVTLLDSLNKRINFLNEVVKELELENVETVHGRAEEFGKNRKYRESFDVATSRAVANLATLSEYMIPLVKKEGKVICMKGPDIEEEMNNSKIAIKILGGNIEKVDNFELPYSDIKRNVVFIKKVKETPEKFPRKAGMPAKEPIK